MDNQGAPSAGWARLAATLAVTGAVFAIVAGVLTLLVPATAWTQLLMACAALGWLFLAASACTLRLPCLNFSADNLCASLMYHIVPASNLLPAGFRNTLNVGLYAAIGYKAIMFSQNN